MFEHIASSLKKNNFKQMEDQGVITIYLTNLFVITGQNRRGKKMDKVNLIPFFTFEKLVFFNKHFQNFF